MFYRGDSAVVTGGSFVSDGRRFPVAELVDIHRVESGFIPWARWYELRARFRGKLIRLFRCHSAEEFGQVCRALLRAREYAGT